MRLKINDPSVTYVRDVPGIVGPDRVLLESDDNLIAGLPWERAGYTVEPFLDDSVWSAVLDGLTRLVAGAGGVELRSLERYHEAVAGDAEIHARVARQAGRIHGGTSNLNPYRTRVSLEMRFWRRN